MTVRPHKAAQVFSLLHVSAREGALLRRRLRILLGPWRHLLLRLARGLCGLLRRCAWLCGALRFWFRLGLGGGLFLRFNLLRGFVLFRRGRLQSLRRFRRRVIAFHIFGGDSLRYTRQTPGKQILALSRQFLLLVETEHVELVWIEIRATGKRRNG